MSTAKSDHCPTSPLPGLRLTALALFALTSAAVFGAKGFSVLDNGSLDQWSEQTFDNVPPTTFEPKFDEALGRKVLQIRSDSSSSGWNYDKRIDLNSTPYIRLRWKVEKIGERKGDPSTKQGDDYPLRIYLHKAGFMKLSLSSVLLVLSPVHRKGEVWESPYSRTAWSIMAYALDGTDTLAPGEWREETLNIREIWKKVRDEEPPDELDGISILGDTDGGKSVSVVYLDNVWLQENIK